MANDVQWGFSNASAIGQVEDVLWENSILTKEFVGGESTAIEKEFDPSNYKGVYLYFLLNKKDANHITYMSVYGPIIFSESENDPIYNPITSIYSVGSSTNSETTIRLRALLVTKVKAGKYKFRFSDGYICKTYNTRTGDNNSIIPVKIVGVR